MRIAVADNNSRKFTDDLIKHWQAQGHEVRYEQGASEHLAQWADIYYVDTWDNNIHYLWKLYRDDPDHNRTADWDNKKKPMIVCRALDWEVWIGYVRTQEMIDWVDKVICIAPHIEKRLREDKDNASGETLKWGDKLKCIRPGVNLEKFTLKTKKTDGFQLGMVLGDMWKYKSHMAGLDIFTTLYRGDNRWRLHVRGQHENAMFDPFDWDYYLNSRGIQDVVFLYPHQEDMNQWYENIDILLHPGRKEAFCYAVGEAMAKGIPTIVNDFMGSHEIWTSEGMRYQTHLEAIQKIQDIQFGLYVDLNSIREILKNTYSLERQFKETDEFLGL